MWKVQVIRLENGLTLYCHPGTTNVSGIGIKAGSIYDPPGMCGMAHYVEHLISRISRRHPDARANDLLFQELMGGPDDAINIRTDRWSVFYGHDDLLRRKHMEAIFDVMASFVHPESRLVDLEGMAVEAAAVHQEYYLRGIDWMDALLDDQAYATLYEKNPVRNRVDCEVEDLKHITMKDVERFLHRYYAPQNAFAIILGPKIEEAKAMALHCLRDWEERRIPTLDYDHADDFPRLSSVRSCEIERAGIHQHHVAIAFPTETYNTPDAEALDVIEKILRLRLNWALREGNHAFDGGSYRTPVFVERSFVHGLVSATFATSSREFATRAEDVVLGEYRRLRTDLVPQDELQSAIEAIHNKYLDAFWYRPGDLSEMIIHAAVNGDDDLEKLHAYRGQVLRVKSRHIREVANKYFTKNYARIVIRPA